MNADEYRRWDELYDRGVPPREAAELAEELGDPADVPTGCAMGCVCLVALLVILGAAAGLALVVLGE